MNFLGFTKEISEFLGFIKKHMNFHVLKKKI